MSDKISNREIIALLRLEEAVRDMEPYHLTADVKGRIIELEATRTTIKNSNLGFTTAKKKYVDEVDGDFYE